MLQKIGHILVKEELTFLILESSVTACLFPGSKNKTVSKNLKRVFKKHNKLMQIP